MRFFRRLLLNQILDLLDLYRKKPKLIPYKKTKVKRNYGRKINIETREDFGELGHNMRNHQQQTFNEFLQKSKVRGE
jgi:hypothetical protein